MKLPGQLFTDDFTRFRASDAPENLPGVKKKSFVLPFAGGEIWFEHLDGMYQYTDLVLAKLRTDSQSFLLPSKPSQIGFVLDETVVPEALANEIAELLCNGRKKWMRVCFIGTNRRIEKLLRRALKRRSKIARNFAFAFINDFEEAKEWLIYEK